MRFTLPWPPSVNHLYAKGRNGMRLTEKALQFKQDVAAICFGCAMPIDGPVELVVNLYPPDRRKRDIDNGLKAIQDSLAGFAYHDDQQIKRLFVEMHDHDRQNPRVEVEVCSK